MRFGLGEGGGRIFFGFRIAYRVEAYAFGENRTNLTGIALENKLNSVNYISQRYSRVTCDAVLFRRFCVCVGGGVLYACVCVLFF